MISLGFIQNLISKEPSSLLRMCRTRWPRSAVLRGQFCKGCSMGALSDQKATRYTRVERQLLEGIAEQLDVDGGSCLTPAEFWRVLRRRVLDRGLPEPSFRQSRNLLRKLRANVDRASRSRLMLLAPSLWGIPAGTGKSAYFRWTAQRHSAGVHPRVMPAPETTVNEASSPVFSPASACDECRQEETCRRIDCCVLHNCAFGGVDRP